MIELLSEKITTTHKKVLLRLLLAFFFCLRLGLLWAGRKPCLLEGGAVLDDAAQALEENGGEGLPDGCQGRVRAAPPVEGHHDRELEVLPHDPGRDAPTGRQRNQQPLLQPPSHQVCTQLRFF